MRIIEWIVSTNLQINFSDFSPFIRLWIVSFNDITDVYRPARTITSFLNILKSKLTNISYKDMQNLSSPSDCIQFSVSDNERMIISCIIHISDLRNSTANWSWGVKTQTGFECIITTIVHCKKLDSRSALRTRGRCEQHASRSRRGMHCEFIIQTGFPLSFIFFDVFIRNFYNYSVIIDN